MSKYIYGQYVSFTDKRGCQQFGKVCGQRTTDNGQQIDVSYGRKGIHSATLEENEYCLIDSLNDADTDEHVVASNSATYCPEDNKLRLYIDAQLERDSYLYLMAQKWTYTPKQDCSFVATWTPRNEDICLSLIAEDDQIGDEDYSPTERAADRAERFSGYLAKRRAESHAAATVVESGPNVVGFQDGRKADRAARKLNRVRDYALTQWAKAEYWQHRTQAVLDHAEYKIAPGLRRRRILEIEKLLRKSLSERWKAHYENRLTYENAMLAHHGGKASEVEMEVGGWVFVGNGRNSREWTNVDGWAQIRKLNRSGATKRIVSVGIEGAGNSYYWNTPTVKVRPYNIESLGTNCYRPPTDAEREEFSTKVKAEKATAKATAKKSPAPKLVNPTKEDAERLQALWNADAQRVYDEYNDRHYFTRTAIEAETVLYMTQEQYSANSKGSYCRFDTESIAMHGRIASKSYASKDHTPVAFKVRKAYGDGSFTSCAKRVIVITDKPQKSIPLDWELVESGTRQEAIAKLEAQKMPAIPEPQEQLYSPTPMPIPAADIINTSDDDTIGSDRYRVSIGGDDSFDKLYFEAKAHLTGGDRLEGIALAIAAVKLGRLDRYDDCAALLQIAGDCPELEAAATPRQPEPVEQVPTTRTQQQLLFA